MARRNEIKICKLRNKLEICNLRNRNMSFAKLKSLIVRKSSSVKADLFLTNFIFENNVSLGIIVVGEPKQFLSLSFFLFHSVRSALTTQHSE